MSADNEPPFVLVWLLAAMLVAFILWERAYSPAVYSLVGRLAPAAALGRSRGATFAVFNYGSMLGSPAAVLIIGAGSATLLCIILGPAAVLAAAITLHLDHRLHRRRRHERTRPTLRPA